MADREALGEVTVPSGILLAIDTGYLRLWSHDRPPIMPEGVLAEYEATARANASVEIRIEGPDAEAVGRALDWSPHPLVIFDVPPQILDTGSGMRRRFDQLLAENPWSARLVPLPRRIPHRERVDLALAYGDGSGQLQYHGVWAVAIGRVPTDRPLPVFARRMPAGAFSRRWQSVWVECSVSQVATSERIGLVAVDWARILIGDVDALAAWEHDKPLDGLADVVFWGRDASDLARATSAQQLEGETFGWLDLPIGDAVLRGENVERIRSDRRLTAKLDFRPHSHHYMAMRDARTSPTESGVVDVGGARMINLMTTWGDGLFDVYRDIDVRGALVRIRIEFGTDQRMEQMRSLEHRAMRDGMLAEVSNRIWKDGEPVGFLYREMPADEGDSGWRVFAGDEDPEYCASPDTFSHVTLAELQAREKDVKAIIDAEPGHAFERAQPGRGFVPVEDRSPGQRGRDDSESGR